MSVLVGVRPYSVMGIITGTVHKSFRDINARSKAAPISGSDPIRELAVSKALCINWHAYGYCELKTKLSEV